MNKVITSPSNGANSDKWWSVDGFQCPCQIHKPSEEKNNPLIGPTEPPWSSRGPTWHGLAADGSLSTMKKAVANLGDVVAMCYMLWYFSIWDIPNNMAYLICYSYIYQQCFKKIYCRYLHVWNRLSTIWWYLHYGFSPRCFIRLEDHPQQAQQAGEPGKISLSHHILLGFHRHPS